MMTSFFEWYNALPSTLQVYWTIALVTSLVFVIQMVLTFIGIGDSDADIDFGGDTDFTDGGTLDVGGAMQLFTIRNFVNFLLGLGWGGVCFYDLVPNTVWHAVVAFITGIFFVYIFLFIYKQMFRLEKNGALDIKESVGKTVDVYLTIPGNRAGVGKVQISFNGSVQELNAMTDEEQPIRSGSKVLVREVINGNTLLVSKI